MNGLYFVIMSAAITYILTESVIGRLWRWPMRWFASLCQGDTETYLITLIYCPACTGFWVGMYLWRFDWAAWTAGARLPGLVAACAGLLIGMVLPRITFFNATAELGIEEQEHESTKEGQTNE